MPVTLNRGRAARVCLVFFLSCGATLSAAPAKRAVAVVNFQNASGSRSLDYLKTALPESISGMLASSPEVRVVERAALNRVLKEIELEQSGVIDAGQVSRAGKLVRADVLLIGSFSGNAEKLNVTLKAVDAATGVVLEGRAITAPLSEVLDQSGQAALAMAAVAAGSKTGNLTVLSNPEGADVRVDGVVVGKTPLVEYRLSAGAHRVFVSKSGYREEERNLTIQPGTIETMNETLLPGRKPTMVMLGLGYQRLLPTSGPVLPSNLFLAQLGFTVGKWAFDFSYAMNPSWDHSYTYSSLFATLTDSRKYFLHAFLLGATFELFEFRFIAPYVGVFGGFTQVSDYELKGSDSTSSRISSFDLFQLGGKFGIEILPRQTISFFVEGRYQYFPASVSRTTKVFNQGVLGEASRVEGETNLSSFSVGGGLRLYF